LPVKRVAVFVEDQGHRRGKRRFNHDTSLDTSAEARSFGLGVLEENRPVVGAIRKTPVFHKAKHIRNIATAKKRQLWNIQSCGHPTDRSRLTRSTRTGAAREVRRIG